MNDQIVLTIIAFFVLIINQIRIEFKANKTEEKLKYFKNIIDEQNFKDSQEKIVDYSNLSDLKYSEIVRLYKYHKEKLILINEHLAELDSSVMDSRVNKKSSF